MDAMTNFQFARPTSRGMKKKSVVLRLASTPIEKKEDSVHPKQMHQSPSLALTTNAFLA